MLASLQRPEATATQSASGTRPSPKTPVLASRPGASSSRCSCTPPIIFRRPVENGVVHGAICAQQCSLPPHDTDSSLSVGLNCHDTRTRGASPKTLGMKRCAPRTQYLMRSLSRSSIQSDIAFLREDSGRWRNRLDSPRRKPLLPDPHSCCHSRGKRLVLCRAPQGSVFFRRIYDT